MKEPSACTYSPSLHVVGVAEPRVPLPASGPVVDDGCETLLEVRHTDLPVGRNTAGRPTVAPGVKCDDVVETVEYAVVKEDLARRHVAQRRGLEKSAVLASVDEAAAQRSVEAKVAMSRG